VRRRAARWWRSPLNETSGPDFSLVIPCRNEEALIGGTLLAVEDWLRGHVADYEILVSDDSSTDRSATVVTEYAVGSPQVRLIRGDAARGKGAALSRGFAAARGRIAGFLDADLEIPVENLGTLLEAIRAGADVAIGSKSLARQDRERSPLRRLITWGYSTWVRLWLGSKLSDHQAGIKAMRLDRCRAILARVQNHGWTWDTEFLVYAQQERLVIRECPIETVESARPTRVQVVRDSLRMAGDVVRLALRNVRVR
jgi:glycosyltransferase involved in cell wall biosynthesis